MIADQLGYIALFLDLFVVAKPVDFAVRCVRVVIDFAQHGAVLIIESALARPILWIGVPKMPFADNGRLITGFLERLRQQPLVRCETVGPRRWNDRGLQSVTVWIAAR